VAFNPSDETMFLVGTDEGLIYKCTTEYSSRFKPFEFLCISVCLYTSLYTIILSLLTSIRLCLSLSITLSLCVSLCLSVFLSVSLCFSLSLCVSLCLSLFLSVSLCQSVSVSLCISLCLYVSFILFFLSLSFSCSYIFFTSNSMCFFILTQLLSFYSILVRNTAIKIIPYFFLDSCKLIRLTTLPSTTSPGTHTLPASF
jgi:hypothetical protein